MDIAGLIDDFRTNRLEAARLQGEGRTAAVNTKADASHAAYVELERTDDGREALVALLDDPERVVQLDVAGRLLPAPEALAALERWAQSDDDRGKQAAFTLKYYRMELEE